MVVAHIIIPIAPYHAGNTAAIDSANTQSVPVHVTAVMDVNKTGPAASRNRGLKLAQAPFVVFLDADDSIAPDFVERCLERYEPGHYVYTNWDTDSDKAPHIPAAEFDIFTEGMAHTITCLIPRLALEYIGGFDESLPGMEDIDLFMRLRQAGICGLYLDQVLMTYNRRDGNSPVSPAKPQSQITHWLQDYYQILRQKHHNWSDTMCKCKEGSDVSAMLNAQGSEDVLVQMVNHYNATGPVTGRKYPKPNGQNMLYMNIADAQALERHGKPNKRVRILPNPADISPDLNTVMDLLNEQGGGA